MAEKLMLDVSAANLTFPKDARFGLYSGASANVYFDPHNDEIGIVDTDKIVLTGYAKEWAKLRLRF